MARSVQTEGLSWEWNVKGTQREAVHSDTAAVWQLDLPLREDYWHEVGGGGVGGVFGAEE